MQLLRGNSLETMRELIFGNCLEALRDLEQEQKPSTSMRGLGAGLTRGYGQRFNAFAQSCYQGRGKQLQ